MKDNLLVNYHTHNYLCGHAKGNVIDYVNEALDKGFDILGISDHGPLPKPPFYRMSICEFYNCYLPQIEEAKKLYGNKIKIYSGLEIEYMDNINSFYEELLKHLDYLILGCHYYSSNETTISSKPSGCIKNKEELFEYVNLIERALDTKYFKILAHPDTCFQSYKCFDNAALEATRRIINACLKNNVAIELNASKMRGGKQEKNGKASYIYPLYIEFWQEVSKTNLRVTIGSDCHEPKLLKDGAFDECLRLAKKLGLNVIGDLFN